MAIYSSDNTQTTSEIKTYAVNYTDALPTGGTVTGGTATHIPPSGAASIPYVEVTNPYVYVTLDKPAVVGIHYVDVLATFNDGDKSAARIAISVMYPTPTARSGMADNITTLRGMTNTGINDYTIAGKPYWSDAQMQTVLDRYVTPIRDEPLTVNPVMVSGGTVNYLDYQSAQRFFEATTGGTARFIVKDSLGAVQGTANWTADYERGLVSFAADTKGTAYYLTGYSYDVYAAAADIWYQKAAHASEQIDFSTDNHSIKRSHVANMAFKMAQRYEGMSSSGGGASVPAARGDLNAY